MAAKACMVITAAFVAVVLSGCRGNTDSNIPGEGQMAEKCSKQCSTKTDAELRKQLTEQQYYVTQQKGTESAFNNKYWNTKKDGTYHCICCGSALFSSKTKYDSGTGWPSFWEPISKDAVTSQPDTSLEKVRTEVLCGKCGAHLGHVFDDGQPPSHLRYCINSSSLNLVERKTEK